MMTCLLKKIGLFNELVTKDKVSWEGKYTQKLDNVTVYPRVEQHKLPVFIGVGGTPESVLRTAY
jgi:Luciferase-like monooxygenase.